MIYVVEEYSILHMNDTVLQDYVLFSSTESALSKYPDAIVSVNYTENELENRIERHLRKSFSGCCYVLVEKTIL